METPLQAMCRAPISRRRPRPCTLAVALTAALACAGTAQADSINCKRAIAKASVQLTRLEMKARQRCEDGRLTGKITTACPDAQASAAIAKAAGKLRTSIAAKCGGQDRRCGTGGDDDGLATIGWSLGSCPNLESGACANALANCSDVADCLACVDQSAVGQAIGLYYGALATSSDGKIKTCQREIGRSAGKFFAAKLKALQKCEDSVLRGQSNGPCPDAAAASKIATAAARKDAKLCRACGGGDGACGGGDDLAPATIGFASSCPTVTVPGGSSCGAPIANLSDLVACVACVTDFKVDCLDALTVPALKPYPAECNGSPAPTPTTTPGGGPTPTRTTTPGGGPTPTRTTTPGGGPTPTRTTTPGGGPTSTPTPAAACALPSPLPAVVSFVSLRDSELDTGWTGIAHDVPAIEDSSLTAARLTNCNLNTSSPTCGQCDLDGPILFPGTAKNCFCTNPGSPDSSSLTSCDPEAPSPCSGGESCTCFYGPPLAISAGSVPVCVLNRYAGPISGTANIANAGPQAGEGAVLVHLNSLVHTGISTSQPCPTCLGDTTPRDGNKNGTCNGGARDGQPCDVGGSTTLFGPTSFDCPPVNAAVIGNLTINFNPATTGTATLGTGPKCTGVGFTSVDCFCDTCATATAEPCNSNADCPGNTVCGGRRCIGGTNNGAQCSTASQCAGGGFCTRPGTPTQTNACADGVCSPNPSDGPHEGVCEAGPTDRLCSLESFRGCTSDVDCNPPSAGGNCQDCLPSQTCLARLRECFLNPIVRTGTPGVQTATVAATFCIPPTSSQSVNQTAGLPGPGALELPIRVLRGGAQCGNGALNSGETCDPPADGACPGACQADCRCPRCGDGTVNQPSEQCDGPDDGACPGACQSNCACGSGSCGNNIAEFGEECDGNDAAACPGHCQNDCTCGPFCGNNTVDPGEQCDGSGSSACPPSACRPDCTCGPFCGNDQIDQGEECDGSSLGSCLGSCQSDCTCSPVCGDNHRQAGELCDGSDDSLCPGQCSAACTCPARGTVTFTVMPGADLDTGWTGIAHNSQVQTGSRITGEISDCDGVNDFNCDFFGNIGSFCSGDPSRSCTDNNQCSGAGNCVINTFGPPLPLSAGGVPACIINRFATDVTGTYNLQTGSDELFTRLNSLVHLGIAVSRPCPICDCGRPDPKDCQIGESGTCSDIVGSPACHVQGNGPFGPTSNDCPPSSGLNVSGAGLDIPFTPVTTGTVTFPSSQPCDAAGFQNQRCWCDGQPQPNACNTACDGGGNDSLPCSSDADCPGAPAGACKPLCRQIQNAAVGEGACVAGPADQTCAGAHEVGCQRDTDCPTGKGPCGASARRCFIDPIVRVGTPGTTTDRAVATFCIPATSGTAINQTAGLPGPGAISFSNSVTVQRCGDGIVNRTGEECDGADDGNCPGACRADCLCNRTCGNNVVEFGEQCDGTSSSACPSQCVAPGQPDQCTCPPVCGDGFVGPGETCDPGGVNGAPANDAACPGTCIQCQCPVPSVTCLNQQLDQGEVCDLPALGCGPLQLCLACQECFPPAGVIPQQFICGNQNIEPTEICELPAMGCGDGQICVGCTQCIQTPLPPVCGNGNVETGEVCDLPAVGCGPQQLCLLCQQCVDVPVAVCGNGNLEPGEVCELPQKGCGPLQVCLACSQCVP